MLHEDVRPTYSLLKVDGRYVCADNLRFTCILAIIALHAATILTAGAAKGSAIEVFQCAAISALKFGTIGFFLISGFLLENNLQGQDSFALLRRRVRKVLLPWTFWFLLTSFAFSVFDFARHKRAFLPGIPLHTSLWKTLCQTFTSTSFWFVPNLLLSLIVLLIFRRYLRSLVFGGALLSLSLFYSLNIYTNWMEPQHTRALFGFVFYLWLGHYAAINVERFTGLLHRLPAGLLALATSLSALAAFAEGRLLMHLHSADPLNTLKITTQLFSVLVFLCFFKVQRRMWPPYFDVSRTAFGMYLSHVIALAAFVSPLWAQMTKPGSNPLFTSFAMRVAFWLTTTALGAGASFLLSRFLVASPALSWAVGSPRRTTSLNALVAERKAPIVSAGDPSVASAS